MPHTMPATVAGRCPVCATETAWCSETGTCPNCRTLLPRPIAATRQPIRRPAHTFIYQDLNCPAVETFRDRFNLSGITAGANDEFDALIAIRDWTFQQFANGEPTHWHLDATSILEAGRRGAVFHCTFYSLVSVQVAVTLGYIARRLNIDANEAEPRPLGHMVYDVWCNELSKWIVMDSKANIHFEIDGRPLSALELRQANLEGKRHRIDIVFGRGAEKRILPHDRDELYQWATESDRIRWNRNDERWARRMVDMTNPDIYAFLGLYMSNDLFSRPLDPLRLPRDPVAVWYDHHNANERWFLKPERQHQAYQAESVPIEQAGDFEWLINQTEAQMMSNPDGHCYLNAWTDTPNFDCFQLRCHPNAPWKTAELICDHSSSSSAPNIPWHAPDPTFIEIRSVNRAGIPGVSTKLIRHTSKAEHLKPDIAK